MQDVIKNHLQYQKVNNFYPEDSAIADGITLQKNKISNIICQFVLHQSFQD